MKTEITITLDIDEIHTLGAHMIRLDYCGEGIEYDYEASEALKEKIRPIYNVARSIIREIKDED